MAMAAVEVGLLLAGWTDKDDISAQVGSLLLIGRLPTFPGVSSESDGQGPELEEDWRDLGRAARLEALGRAARLGRLLGRQGGECGQVYTTCGEELWGRMLTHSEMMWMGGKIQQIK